VLVLLVQRDVRDVRVCAIGEDDDGSRVTVRPFEPTGQTLTSLFTDRMERPFATMASNVPCCPFNRWQGVRSPPAAAGSSVKSIPASAARARRTPAQTRDSPVGAGICVP